MRRSTASRPEKASSWIRRITKFPISPGLWRKGPSYSKTLPTILRRIAICQEFRAVYTPFPWQVIQKPGLVALLYEYPHGIRIIHTDGSHQHPKGRDVLNTWMGDSVGHWDGDTLVVDANGFNDQTWLDMAANFHSDQLHVVER